MKKFFFKSIFASFIFISWCFLFGIIYLKVRATVSTASPDSALSANNRNELLTQVFQKNWNNLYYMTWNIGIGIKNPTEKLQINWYLSLTGNYPLIRTRSAVWGTNSHWFQFQNRNIDIWNTNPTEKLDLNWWNIKMWYELLTCSHWNSTSW